VSKLLENYQSTRAYTELLCKPLNVEDYIPQAVDFTSPPKWHLAHTTWFFEEMILSKYTDEYVVFDDSFGFLFNSYYQGIGDRAVRSQRGLITRPTVEQVYAYRHYVDKHIQKLLTQNIHENVEALIILGINHEQQHQELLITDLKYTFSFNPTLPVYDENKSLVADHNTAEGWTDINEGIYDVGYSGDNFCFDNELGAHKVYLHHYSISQALVTNGDYIDFIESGAYQHFQYWLDEGWSWVCQNHISSPLYWQKNNGEWFCYTLAGLKPIDRNAILSHISYYEANAFANWKNMRLPTEFEWEVASQHFDWGKRWEWTSSAYQPYPGFYISEGAVGEYNGKFMINQMVLRGASVATTTGHSRCTYRNFFHPHFQWQYSGIRLVK
jgi:ergothioneine biosynthesis protein EgtB